MHNPGDDRELDLMSREAAGRYTAPGIPDWQKMETELDKVLPVEKKRRGILYWWLLPVLLAGGATYWLLQNDNDTVQAQTNGESNVIADKTTTSVPALKERSSTGTIHAVAEKNAASAPADHPVIRYRSYENNTAAVRAVPGAPAATGVSTQQNNISKKELTTVSAQPNSIDNSVKQDQGLSKSATEQAEKDPVSNQLPPAVVTTKTTPETNAITEQPATVNSSTATVEELPVVTDKKNLASYLYGKGWSLAAIGGIDKSTVKFSYGDKAGINIGIIGGYHFNDKLSLHLGAIYTQKNYTLAGQDFNAPKGSWASYYKLDEVEGYCRMWELPLMARYAFPQQGRNNYFLSTGLSSYFMTSEHYTYYYHHQGQPASRSASYGAGDRHVLSILHLSGGFERTLSRNLRLQIEPYAKLPLSGVGLGSIQLSSFGINFGLQLRQPSKH